MSGFAFRPITDLFLLARPKLPKKHRGFYGSFPAGFLERARSLLGISINDPLLHVCGGLVREYPFRGMGPNDRTVDLDPKLDPDYLMDVRRLGAKKGDQFPVMPEPVDRDDRCKVLDVSTDLWKNELWPAALVDPPYSEEDAEHYTPGRDAYPARADLLRRCLSVVRPGGRVGFLDFVAPRPPKKDVRLVALITVLVGYGNQARIYSVYEREDPAYAGPASKRAAAAIRGQLQAGSRRRMRKGK